VFVGSNSQSPRCRLRRVATARCTGRNTAVPDTSGKSLSPGSWRSRRGSGGNGLRRTLTIGNRERKNLVSATLRSLGNRRLSDARSARKRNLVPSSTSRRAVTGGPHATSATPTTRRRGTTRRRTTMRTKSVRAYARELGTVRIHMRRRSALRPIQRNTHRSVAYAVLGLRASNSMLYGRLSVADAQSARTRWPRSGRRRRTSTTITRRTLSAHFSPDLATGASACSGTAQ